ncbi:phytoene desaturase [Paenibacillus albicereus]|uniref:4,4'-diaponeurosporene oxygenase n=1 Tax=Paenibacillus albicereus TaxID=2726185 RepID=A0A6H2H3F7_9BACL|nr:phytoene desaturase family protein [Paenibacillus albicereus]QJC53956.1 phytoene desaturase [Paenibacillus albicereus]
MNDRARLGRGPEPAAARAAAGSRRAGRRIAVVGGGLGGLSCAIHLAAQGCRVTLLEKEPELGGKLQRVEADGYRFDNGPSTLTMQPVFDAVFEAAGRRREDYVRFRPLDPIARNRFADGTVVDLTSDAERMEAQIAAYSPEDARNYRAYMRESARLHALAEREFLSGLILDWKDRLRPSLLAGFARIRPLASMERTLRSYFRHPNTLAMFGRYATYVGSAPRQTPAVFNMMAHIEAGGGGGVFAAEGGSYAIVEAYARLARELGVDIRTGAEVRRIAVLHGRAAGVETDSGFVRADAVVLNADPLQALRRLVPELHRPSMPDRRLDRPEPSVAGFVLLLGVRGELDGLLHHNVFFPDDYEAEFDDLFRRRELPADPAVYVCRSGAGGAAEAGPGNGRTSLFALVNAPAQRDGLDYEALRHSYAQRVLDRLEAHGLSGIAERTATEAGGLRRVLTPDDLARRTGAWRGAIYGMSSNRPSQAFFRFPSRDRDIRGLWYAGGSTHPGGGTPIVTIGGRLVAERLLEELDG